MKTLFVTAALCLAVSLQVCSALECYYCYREELTMASGDSIVGYPKGDENCMDNPEWGPTNKTCQGNFCGVMESEGSVTGVQWRAIYRGCDEKLACVGTMKSRMSDPNNPGITNVAYCTKGELSNSGSVVSPAAMMHLALTLLLAVFFCQ